ncbi:CBS domain-containing protein [Rubrobacter taiwanensis]|jgi:acetoin utilization protein AcuB|uniref:CBS domain-containing protein n=1 Tax=Rubrobacter taiwanensis TaxID=185139 RepID=A0A4R1BQB8_9ACTN|nr:CBS and ACT domain-containing protein [Rubrobacter taiwanensis]TCJ19923.1 CBS domain-containing protein [Rubrobacter taiwanensis]
MLVEDCMTREVLTVTPETTAGEALRMSRERRIRHFPVLENGRLVGIISDRDLRDAAPPAGDPERAAALEKLKVKDVMRREVTTAHPLDPIEHAARDMNERRIGCLPVVSGGKLVGIITSSDVMRALMRLVGAHEPGSRLELELIDRPGALAGVAEIIRDLNVNIVSVLSAPGKSPGKKTMVLRLAMINPTPVVQELESAGYRILWPPQQEEE